MSGDLLGQDRDAVSQARIGESPFRAKNSFRSTEIQAATRRIPGLCVVAHCLSRHRQIPDFRGLPISRRWRPSRASSPGPRIQVFEDRGHAPEQTVTSPTNETCTAMFGSAHNEASNAAKFVCIHRLTIVSQCSSTPCRFRSESAPERPEPVIVVVPVALLEGSASCPVHP